MPPSDERSVGAHVVLVVGFDDAYPAGPAGPGALLIRNSWGIGWGDNGYGWLPYQYLSLGLAHESWMVLPRSWMDLGRSQKGAWCVGG